jgi:hypothetical protein
VQVADLWWIHQLAECDESRHPGSSRGAGVAGDVSVAMITGDSVLAYWHLHCSRVWNDQSQAGTQVILGSKFAGGMIEWANADTEESLDIEERHVCLAVSGEVWALLRENDPTYASINDFQARSCLGSLHW